MSDTDEYRFKIEAYTPETMPMERLAAYLTELALMLGEPKSVHFVRLDLGSTSVVHRIEREAIPKVRARTHAVRRGVGPRDTVRAYRKINKMLREDNGSAVWQDASTAMDLLFFPGMAGADETVSTISQHGSLDGVIVRVGGLQHIVPIMLKCEHEEISGCWARRDVAKALAHRLFEPVRLFGTGRWHRSDEGVWKLDIFRVETFAALRDVTLSEALNELRAIPSDWSSESFLELPELRGMLEGPVDGGV